MMSKKINSLFIVIILGLFCSCFVHKAVDCEMVFNLCIVNESEDTISVVINRDPSKIKSYSFKSAVLLPMKSNVLVVDYAWGGTDGCSANCASDAYSGYWFGVNFKKNNEVLRIDTIIPCKPCNKSQNKYDLISQDSLYVLTDTIYYRP